MENCSFCWQSSDSRNVVGIEGLEFNDRNGLSTFVIEIVNEILPEVMNAATICKECLSTVCNFYQLKLDIRLALHKYGETAEQNTTKIKDEIEDAIFTSSLNCGSFSSSDQAKSDGNIKISAVKSLSNEAPKNETKPVAIKIENEDELMVEVDEPMESDGIVRNMYNDFSSTSSPVPETSFDATDMSVLPSTELIEFKEMFESRRGSECSVCSKSLAGTLAFYCHMMFKHSRNKTLFSDWIRYHTEKSPAVSNKNRPRCCVCPKYANSVALLRNHLVMHIIQGEVSDADFLLVSMKKRSSNEPPKKRKHKTYDVEAEIVKTLSLESKLGINNYTCVICFEFHKSYAIMFCHFYEVHVKNDDPISAWVEWKVDEVRESLEITDKWPCCVCPRKTKDSDINLGRHLKEHLEKGEIDVTSATFKNEILLSCKARYWDIEISHARSLYAQKMAENSDLIEVDSENENKLPNETAEPQELEEPVMNIYEFTQETFSELETALKSAVLPSAELQVLKEVTEKIAEGEIRCPICSETHYSKRMWTRHMIFSHCRNQKLFKAWIERQLEAIQKTGNIKKQSCCICQRVFGRYRIDRHHFFLHIIRGHVEDAVFLSMTVEKSEIKAKTHKDRQGKYMYIKRQEKDLVKAQCQASKTDSGTYECVFCSATFICYIEMYSHMGCIHVKNDGIGIFLIKSKIDEIREASTVSNQWPCCVCESVLDSELSLQWHLEAHSQNGELKLPK